MNYTQKLFHLIMVLSLLLASCSDPTALTPTPNVIPTVQQESTAQPIARATEVPEAVAGIEESAESTPLPTNTPSAEPTATSLPEPTATVEVSAESTPASATVSLATASFTPLYGNSAPTIDNLPAFDQILDTSLQLMPLLADFEANLDRRQFDLDALSLSLNYDADRAVAFVRDEINFEPYVGILRGEFGTLVSRAGNDVDQARLLRYLLDDAGYETRVAQATLSEAQAAQLLTQIAVRHAAPLVGDNAEISAARAQIIESMGLEQPTERDVAFSAEIASDYTFVLDTLAAAGVNLGGGQLDQLLADMQNYYWVQYRFSPFDEWNSAHVAFGDGAIEIEPETTYLEILPDSLHHRLQLAVYVERAEGDSLQVHQTVRNVEMNSADLFGRSLTYSNQPNNVTASSTDDLQTQLSQANIFAPFLDGELAGDAFDLAGRPYSLELLTSNSVGALPLFQTITDSAQAVAVAAGVDDAQLALTAQWVEYTQITPDNERTTTRRYIIDRIGEANREAGIAEINDGLAALDAAQQLMTGHTIALLSGSYTPNYVAHRQLQRLLQEGRIIEYAAANPDLQEPPEHLIAAVEPNFDLMAAQLLDSIVPDGIVAYRPEPTLIVHEQGYVPGRAQATAFERIDVVSNQRQVLNIADSGVAAAPEIAVQIGIMETALEPLLLQPRIEGTVRPINTLEMMRAAAADGVEAALLLPSDKDMVADLMHSDQTKQSIERDLEAGYLVIVPSASSDAETGWWRVDLATGETLGIATGGYGAGVIEYLVSLGVGLSFGLVGYTECRVGGGTHECCLLQNLASGYLGFYGGALAGQILSATITTLVFDIGYNSLSISPVFPNVCG